MSATKQGKENTQLFLLPHTQSPYLNAINMNEQNELITLLQDSARSFIQQHQAVTTDINSLWSAMAEQGWLGLSLPEALGGSELGIREITALSHLFGEACLATRFISQAIMPSAILSRVEANHSLASQLAGQLIDGSSPLALAWQEQIGQLGEELPTCTLANNTLNGSKIFVAGSDTASHFLVTAQHTNTGNESFCIVAIERQCQGVSIDVAFDSDQGFGAVNFDNVRIDDNAIILTGQPAQMALKHSLLQGRIALAAELEGVAGGCLTKTLEHLTTRKQFGKTLGSFQAIKHRCVDLLIARRLASASYQRAVRSYLSEESSMAEKSAQASAAKARCSDTAFKVAKESIQMHGAMGFTEEAGIGNYMRAALSQTAWLGTIQQHQLSLLAAKEVEPISKQEDASLEPTIDYNAPIDDLNPLSDQEFRLRFRHWLAAHYPTQWTQSHHRPHQRFYGPELRQWLKTLNEHGWRAPDWPKEYGGLELSFRKQLIYKEELNRVQAARIVDNGETQLGPTIMKFGTAEQKALYLPRILNSEDHWAQGYSEPNAGSDLASLSTKADLQGDHFMVNGQKIWTTFASECSHIYMLVRTGKFEKKQQGISFLFVDLQSPGITINPILNIAGETELCEVFFDNVKVPANNLVGELHQGWAIAKSLLGHERIWLGDPTMAMRALALAQQLVTETKQRTNAAVATQLASLTADLHDYSNLYADICDEVAETHTLGPEVSILKVYASELLQRISEFSVSMAGEYGAASGDITIGDTPTNLPWQLMMARPTTIYAGCNEVQRDILAVGMGLPR